MISRDDSMARNSLGYKWGKPTPRPSYRPSGRRPDWSWGGGYGNEPSPRPGFDTDPGFALPPDPNRPSYDTDPGFSRFPSDMKHWYDTDPGFSPRPDTPIPRGGLRPVDMLRSDSEPNTDVWRPNNTEPFPGANDRLNKLLNPTGQPLNTRWRGNSALETYQGDRVPTSEPPLQDYAKPDPAAIENTYLNQNLDKYNFGDNYNDNTKDVQDSFYAALEPGYQQSKADMDKLTQEKLDKITTPEEQQLSDIYNMSQGGDPYYGGTPNSRRRNTVQSIGDTSRIDPNYWRPHNYYDFGSPPGPNGQPRNLGAYSDEAQGYDNYWGNRR